MGIFGFKPNVEEMEKKKDIDGLMKALRHKDDSIKQRAAEALGRIGEPAVDPLIRALKDEGSSIRYRAAEALANTGHPRAMEPLIQALADESSGVREHAARGLGRIGDPKALQPLAQALRDEKHFVRQEAASALAKIGDPRAFQPLVQSLVEKDSFVRWEVAEALDELGWTPSNDVEKAHYLIAKLSWGELVILGEPAVEPLSQALKYELSNVHEGAAWALAEIKRHTLNKVKLTKRLVHILIYTEETFIETKEDIAGCLAVAFPEEVKEDLAAGTFSLRPKGFQCSIVRSLPWQNLSSSFFPPGIRDSFFSWTRTVRRGVHDLPRKDDVAIGIRTLNWGATFFHVLLEKVNPDYATSRTFIRKWSIVAGNISVIGVYSLAAQ
jgi:hypothetical protein